MTRSDRRHLWRAASVRVRLGLALGVALLPVLVLSGLQSALVFERNARDQRDELVGAARQGAAVARARISESQQLLRGLDAAAAGSSCVTYLADTRRQHPGYANLIRFNTDGWVTCSAAPVPVDPDRATRPWFLALANGRTTTVTSGSESDYASDPALLSSVRVEQTNGQFAGVLTAVITLGSLLPERDNISILPNSQVALVDASGRFASTHFEKSFPANLGRWLSGAARTEGFVWLAADREGETRLFTATPVAGREIYLVLSAPSEGMLSWARLNPVSAFLLPILAFALALIAVWWVADREVVRWVVYLRRIAALYARGRYSVRPLKAGAAPSEIRDLAAAFDSMAETIASRDAALRDSLSAKDDLMREIHHRVKNNLQVISSLLHLQQRALVNPVAIAALHDARQRIVALGLIYRALYEGHDLKKVDFGLFLNELVAQLLMDRQGHDHRTRTELHVDPLEIDPDRLAPLALFVVEGVAAACGRSFAGVEGIISIEFRVQGDRATLTIGDNGAPASSRGGDRSMMAIFARQLGGEVSQATDEKGRMGVRLSFPMRGPPGRAKAPP